MKKQYLLILAAVAIGVAVSFGMTKQGGANVLQVNDIGTDPAAYSGVITVAGLMAGVSQADPTIFGIMDLKELQCNSPNCNKVLIPVKYSGKQPVRGDEVKVTGSFIKVGEGYMFQAEKVKVVKNHSVGG